MVVATGKVKEAARMQIQNAVLASLPLEGGIVQSNAIMVLSLPTSQRCILSTP